MYLIIFARVRIAGLSTNFGHTHAHRLYVVQYTATDLLAKDTGGMSLKRGHFQQTRKS